MKRAGLDYWSNVDPLIHENWEEYQQFHNEQIGGNQFFISKFGERNILELDFFNECKEFPKQKKLDKQRDSLTFIFGSETLGKKKIKQNNIQKKKKK